METVSFNVPSITCSVCSGKIQNGLGEINGIEKTNVDLKTKTVTVSYDSTEVSPKDISKKIVSLGYEVIQ